MEPKFARTLGVVATVVILLALLYFGWPYVAGLFSSAPSPLPDETLFTPGFLPLPASVISTSDWKTFKNDELGVGFKYPANWGEANGKYQSFINSFGKNADYYSVKFSSNAAIVLSGVSTDFEAPATGSDFYYRGNPSLPVKIDWEMQVNPPKCGPSANAAYNLHGWVTFNTTGRRLSGLAFIMPILSEEQAAEFMKEYYPLSQNQKSCDSLNGPEGQESLRLRNELRDKIYSGKVDSESQRLLSVFNEIVRSSKVTK